MNDKLFKTGRAMYLLGIAELAIYNFFKGDFAMTRPKAFPEALQFLNPALAYISGALFLLAVIAFFLNRYRFVDLSHYCEPGFFAGYYSAYLQPVARFHQRIQISLAHRRSIAHYDYFTPL